MDSRDRSGGSATNFSMTLPQTLVLESGHQGRIDDLRLPVVVQTISGTNDSLTVLRGGSLSFVSIPHGNASTGNDLASRIQQALRTQLAGSWTVYYDASNMLLAIESDSDFQLTNQGTYSNQLLSKVFSRGSGRHYAFHYVTVQGLDMAYLCCSNFSHMDTVGPKGACDVLCAIPITVGYGSVEKYSMSSSVFFDVPALTLQQLSFQLRDRDFNIINSFANISFTLTID